MSLYFGLSSPPHPISHILFHPFRSYPFYLNSSQNITLSIRCPDAWIYDAEEGANEADSKLTMDIPVFGPNDLVGGSVFLNPEIVEEGEGRLDICVCSLIPSLIISTK